MAELKQSRVNRYRALLGAYHVELENLMRTLEALEQVGLTLSYTVKRVTVVHDRAEKFLEQMDAGEFDSKALAKLTGLFNEGYFRGFGDDEAFENPRGRAVQQMAKTDKRWQRLHEFIFRGDQGEFEELSQAEEEALTQEVYAVEEEA
jgi:hypothetical protein